MSEQDRTVFTLLCNAGSDIHAVMTRHGREGVVYSDRFIPSRSASARRNFSALDRESAASESARLSDREVSTVVREALANTK